MTMTRAGKVVLDQDIPAGTATASTTWKHHSKPDPVVPGRNGDKQRDRIGYRPSGTFTATKYTYTSGDATGTVRLLQRAHTREDDVILVGLYDGHGINRMGINS